MVEHLSFLGYNRRKAINISSHEDTNQRNTGLFSLTEQAPSGAWAMNMWIERPVAGTSRLRRGETARCLTIIVHRLVTFRAPVGRTVAVGIGWFFLFRCQLADPSHRAIGRCPFNVFSTPWRWKKSPIHLRLLSSYLNFDGRRPMRKFTSCHRPFATVAWHHQIFPIWL